MSTTATTNTSTSGLEQRLTAMLLPDDDDDDDDYVDGFAGVEPASAAAAAAAAQQGLDGDENIGWQQLEPRAYALYSAAFGVALETAVYPLDVLKTRQQHDLRAVPRSITSISREVWAREGLRGLFRGYLANSLGSWPGQVVYYGGFELSKDALTRLLDRQRGADSGQPASGMQLAAVSLAAGFVADVTCMVVHSPADTVSQRLMVATYVRDQDRPDMKRRFRIRDVVRDVIEEEGFRGFYRGYFASIVTYAPSSAIWFCTYDVCKDWLRKHRKQTLRLVGLDEDQVGAKTWRTSMHLLSGAAAGATSSFFTNPLDVARTRQMCMDATNPHDKAILDRGFFHVLSWTAKREGMTGLFRGFLPRLFVAVPGSAFTFATYELAKRMAMKPVPGPDPSIV